MTTTTEFTRVTIPDTAERRYWLAPETWKPGIPIYDPTADSYGYSRSTRLITIKRLVPHDGDCTGTACDRWGTEAWNWEADPGSYRQSWLMDDFATLPDGPGTEFYGATIGERKP